MRTCHVRVTNVSRMVTTDRRPKDAGVPPLAWLLWNSQKEAFPPTA
jgi:hypothetical protein